MFEPQQHQMQIMRSRALHKLIDIGKVKVPGWASICSQYTGASTVLAWRAASDVHTCGNSDGHELEL